MSENNSAKPPEFDASGAISDFARVVHERDRLYPTDQRVEALEYVIANPDLFAPEETLAAVHGLQQTLAERDAATPAVGTLAEAEQVLNDAGQRLHDFYPEAHD